ncbi:MAG: phytanoyl-CoA dioxygenase family protein [Myxococcota bacterium]
MPSQDRSFFETFGFLHLPGLLSTRIAEIEHAFDACAARWREAHPGQRVSIANILGEDPRLASIGFGDPLVSVIRDLLGDDFSYVGSTGQVFSGECTPWHSDDGAGRLVLPFRSLRISIYLEDLHADSGCLRVIPGSHHANDQFSAALSSELATGVSTNRVAHELSYWGRRGHQIPSVALESAPGDVLIFDANIKHAAFHARGPRRLITMNHVPRVSDADSLRFRQLLAFVAHRNTLYGQGAHEPVTKTLQDAATVGEHCHIEQLVANADAYRAGCQIAEQQRHGATT